MDDLAAGGIAVLGVIVLFVALAWMPRGNAYFRWRVKRFIAGVLVLALIAYLVIGFALETVT